MWRSIRRSSIAWFLGTAADSLFASTFPCHCRFCNIPLTRISRIPVCEACLDAARPLEGPVCVTCGQPLPQQTSEGQRCLECLQVEPEFDRVVAFGSYEGVLRNLIHLLKYQRVRPAATVLGRMLAEAVLPLQTEFHDRPPLVVPVPLHTSKLRQRGFNQAELIAGAMLEQFSGFGLKINAGVLRRQRPTTSQTGLARPQRQSNLRGAFKIKAPNEIAGRDILLIDDVYTTGTTVSECARVLRRAGASCVWVATVARVLKSESVFDPVREVDSLAQYGEVGHAGKKLDDKQTIGEALQAHAAEA